MNIHNLETNKNDDKVERYIPCLYLNSKKGSS